MIKTELVTHEEEMHGDKENENEKTEDGDEVTVSFETGAGFDCVGAGDEREVIKKDAFIAAVTRKTKLCRVSVQCFGVESLHNHNFPIVNNVPHLRLHKLKQSGRSECASLQGQFFIFYFGASGC